MLRLPINGQALPSPPDLIRNAPRFSPPPSQLPVNYIIIPPKLSTWGNDVVGDCTTAEEAFAKACHAPEIFIPEDVVETWCWYHGTLQGAWPTQVMDYMQNDGFVIGSKMYCDGPYALVDYMSDFALRSAISKGPIKLFVASAQLYSAYIRQKGNKSWLALGFKPENEFNHVISLCGYGSIGWLAGMLDFKLPAAVDKALAGYAFFAYDSIGIMDQFTANAIISEAWLRQPTTIIRPYATVPLTGEVRKF